MVRPTLKRLIADKCETEYEFIQACINAGLVFYTGELDEYTKLFPKGHDSPPPASGGTE